MSTGVDWCAGLRVEVAALRVWIQKAPHLESCHRVRVWEHYDSGGMVYPLVVSGLTDESCTCGRNQLLGLAYEPMDYP